MCSEKGCVGLQLSEVTKNKTLNQTDLWILIRALTSERKCCGVGTFEATEDTKKTPHEHKDCSDSAEEPQC